MTQATSQPGTVQRQITLPLSKAVEIAYKSIRLRLSRSLLVTSGIVLALAFLMSIQATQAVTDGMRDWVENSRKGSAQFDALRQRRDAIDAQLKPMEIELRNAIAKVPALAADAAKFDAKKHFGQEWAELQKDLGAALPAPPDQLTSALTADPSLLGRVDEWVKLNREAKSVRDELTAPQQLEAAMKANGVPTTPDEIASNRIQTRWLLGLALLVAFVGILNAMLMSVTERFREIGTMKCLGALDSFIIKLFLLESLFQGIVGTVLGIVIGLLLSILALVTSYGDHAWQNMPVGTIATAALVSLAIGVGLTVAGAVYPAWQAARMQPIEAMRVEA